jgi:D-alanyl-D-alanine carboxypeptidase
MLRVPAEAPRGLRRGVVNLAAALTALALAGAPSQARAPQKQAAPSAFDNPRYAAIVVDANSGATLRQSNADSLRHPASLAKIMTLYLLFERIEAGKLKLSTPLSVSEQAAAQAPTKLGLIAGQSITVEDAIKALITKSANDAAVVVAEALAGSEEDFARLMTRKARALGMTRTVYRNASGLPDDDQVTTARDQARLGVLIQERFPRFYRYFSLANFTYRGSKMRNHNHLLGQLAGVDGIKTGYTRASGYNLVTSMRRGGRHIVAVVLGGNSASQRDAHMRALIERHIAEASLKRPEVKVARAPQTAEPRTAAHAEPPAAARPVPRIVIVPVVAPPSAPAAAVTASAAPAAAERLNPTIVKTVPIRAATGALLIPNLSAYAPSPELGAAALESSPLPGPSETQASEQADEQASEPETPRTVETVTGNIGGRTAVPDMKVAPNRAARAAGGWAIQVGAFEHEDEAKQRLAVARTKAAKLLVTADPYTEKTIKGDKTFYRARFAGFDRAQAEAACKLLQRNDVACLALKI